MDNAGELIFPSFFCPTVSGTIIQTLEYSPSLNCCLFVDADNSQIPFLDLSSRSIVKTLSIEGFHHTRVIAISPDELLLAIDVDYQDDLPTQVRLLQLSRNGNDSKSVTSLHSSYIKPGFKTDDITSITFYPDAKSIAVTIIRSRELRRGAWLKIYDVPDNLWSIAAEESEERCKVIRCEEMEERSVGENSDLEEDAEEDMKAANDPCDQDGKAEDSSYDNNAEQDIEAARRGESESDDSVQEIEVDNDSIVKRDIEVARSGESGSDHCQQQETVAKRNNVQLDAYELNVINQGFSIPPSPPESSSDSEYSVEEYYDRRYCMRYVDESDLYVYPSGFYCLAISPDATRLLTGNHDGEVFITNETTLDVLQCIRANEKDTIVSGCHYNPIFAHDEFVTCGGNEISKSFKVWRVDSLDDGTETASCVHSVKLQSVPVSCCYSPDGTLIAVTCRPSLDTHIFCSQSTRVLYTLTSIDEQPKPRPARMPAFSPGVTFFAGRTCQVLTTPNHKNYAIAIWSLPVVYSLETLCFLAIRASVRYSDIDALCLPNALKLGIKYLYV